jgi:hypothetical protein
VRAPTTKIIFRIFQHHRVLFLPMRLCNSCVSMNLCVAGTLFSINRIRCVEKIAQLRRCNKEGIEKKKEKKKKKKEKKPLAILAHFSFFSFFFFFALAHLFTF